MDYWALIVLFLSTMSACYCQKSSSQSHQNRSDELGLRMLVFLAALILMLLMTIECVEVSSDPLREARRVGLERSPIGKLEVLRPDQARLL